VSTQATIEVVRGQPSEGRAEQILNFWAAQGALEGDEALRRLAEVVCVALDDAGELVAVNSVYGEDVPMIGGRRFWIYRCLLAEDSAELWSAMAKAAFGALAAEFEPSKPGPVGLYVMVTDRAEMERRPEVLWPETELMFAGYLEDDTQVRIRYFEGAMI
jgi:hypothetical protein